MKFESLKQKKIVKVYTMIFVSASVNHSTLSSSSLSVRSPCTQSSTPVARAVVGMADGVGEVEEVATGGRWPL